MKDFQLELPTFFKCFHLSMIVSEILVILTKSKYASLTKLSQERIESRKLDLKYSTIILVKVKRKLFIYLKLIIQTEYFQTKGGDENIDLVNSKLIILNNLIFKTHQMIYGYHFYVSSREITNQPKRVVSIIFVFNVSSTRKTYSRSKLTCFNPLGQTENCIYTCFLIYVTALMYYIYV
ncbi:Hypothetical_protein [Hexamita inflata]|uniref:Hypothetical_protein n=1 Tax=Hexamita inflata TaxID=28002 RepID=A0AA86R460_9EUKA|nr:Hypothetical protein HINF_LOCUS53154 [Hexamita inflata]